MDFQGFPLRLSKTGSMSRSRIKIVLVLLLLFIGAVPQACAQVNHIRITDDERFLLCASQVLGKPVLGYSLGHISNVSCPDTPQDLHKSLQQNGVSIFEQSDFIYLARSAKQQVPISLDPRDDFASKPGCRQLTKDEINEISNLVLAEVRLVDLSIPYAPPGTDKVTANLIVSMGACHLRPGVESIVGQVASAGHRLFYGEFKDGKAKILWDSPPAVGWIEGLQDMDGDGIPEILVSERSGRQNAECFSVYDLNGNDLTEHADPDGAGCIIGLETELEKRPDGKVDILADSPNEESAEGHPDRYTLVNGRYALQKSASPQEQPNPASHAAEGLNEEGMRLMKEKDYAAAAEKFEEAFNLPNYPPSSSMVTKALFANNAGFAYYKMGKHDQSEFWFERAIGLDPKRAVAYLNLGDALVKLNRNAEARQAYQKYLELAPNSKAAPDVKKKLDALPPGL
jgi:hypothetical protein